MSTRAKKIFLLLSVVVPFLVYSIIYYAPMIRNAPFKAEEFVSLSYSWGLGAHLDNHYNSATGEYHYINAHDSLVVKHFKLDADAIKELDKAAHVQGFFNLPGVMSNDETSLQSPDKVRFEITLNYQRKSKKVIFVSDFQGNEKMKDAFIQTQKVLEGILSDSE